MGKLEQKLKKVLKKKSVFEESSDYKKFTDFYLEMQREGLVRPKKYDLPPLDTIGKRKYQSK